MQEPLMKSDKNSTKITTQSKRETEIISGVNTTQAVFKSNRPSTLAADHNSIFVSGRKRVSPNDITCSYIMFREDDKVLNVVGFFKLTDLERLKRFIMTNYQGWDLEVKVWDNIRTGKNKFGTSKTTINLIVNNDGTLTVTDIEDELLKSISFYSKEFNITGVYQPNRKDKNKK